MEFDFSETVEYIPEWNKNKQEVGDKQVKATLSLLDMGELIQLIAITAKANQDSDDGVAGAEGTALMVKAAQDFLPQHVTIKNFRKLNGDELDIDTIVRFPIFMNFTVELLQALIEASTPNEDDVGNLKGQPG